MVWCGGKRGRWFGGGVLGGHGAAGAPLVTFGGFAVDVRGARDLWVLMRLRRRLAGVRRRRRSTATAHAPQGATSITKKYRGKFGATANLS